MSVPSPRAHVERPLHVLVVDDEPPALAELAWLLGRDDRVTRVTTAESAVRALQVLQEEEVDAVFSDIRMPGLTGLELVRVLHQFSTPPPVVFVTAHDEHAVDAFDLNVVDYVLKPVREERLSEAVRRVLRALGPGAEEDDVEIPVELGGVTRFVSRRDVTFVEASGDYARLHTASGSHLVRMPISRLERDWHDAGFLRIHRSVLISLPHVEEVRVDGGRYVVVVSGRELTASRRHSRELRTVLQLGGRHTPEPS